MKYLIFDLESKINDIQFWSYAKEMIKGLEAVKRHKPHFYTGCKPGPQSALNTLGWSYSLYRFKRSFSRYTVLLWMIFIWPALMVYALFILAKEKVKFNTQHLICFSILDVLIAALPAVLLRYHIIWIHDGSMVSTYSKGIIKYLLLKLSKLIHIVIPSEYLQNELHTYGIAQEQLTVIHPISSLNVSSERAIPNRFTLSTISSLDYDSGVNSILKVVEVLREFIPDIELLIIGKGRERNSLLWIIRRMGLEEHVRIIGDDEQMDEWVGQSHVYIVPEKARLDAYEGIIIAAKCKKPVIAPRLYGFDEIVTHQKSGFVIEPQNHELCAQMVLNIYNNSEWITTMGLYGKKDIEKRYDFEAAIESLNKLLTE